MGLFDFVGDIGKKIFSKEEEASAAVTNHINETTRVFPMWR